MNRKIIPPNGNKLNCANWQIEAAYRMIQHNLDQSVAEKPDELIVYGGKGKAARNWECFDSILRTLERLNPNETLLRLLEYMPGHCLPLHYDGFEGFKRLYGT